MTVVFVVSTPGKLLVLQLAQLIDRVSLPACRSVRLQVCQLLKIWDVSLIIKTPFEVGLKKTIEWYKGNQLKR